MGSSIETTVAVPVLEAEALPDAGGAVVIDLRSPSEFAEDHVPGARNVPLFDDVGRAVIGTLYARVSPEAAFEEGRERTLARIDSLTKEIAHIAGWDVPPTSLEERVREMCTNGIAQLDGELQPTALAQPPPNPVVLHCWRGGLRSRCVVAFLRGLGLERAVGLRGGYKGYRRDVLQRLEGWSGPQTFVLRGLTGVGKTLVLREIEKLRPEWTLDLEALAGHRSSILGMVGLEPCSQKSFDSRLAVRLRKGFGSAPARMVVEGESRKVGDVIVPPRIWESMKGGSSIELVAGTDRRVEVLVDDYLERPENRAALAQQLPFIEGRIGGLEKGLLVHLLHTEREAELVELLLERYYDPLYRHSEKNYRMDARFDTEDPSACAREVVEWIEGRSAG